MSISQSVTSDRPPSTRLRAGRAPKVAILAGVMLATGLVPVTVASGDLDDQKRAADAAASDAHSGVLASNQVVDAATRAVLKVRKLLVPAQAKLAAAQTVEAEALSKVKVAREQLAEAVNEIRIAQAELDAIEAEINELRGDVGSFARRAYQMGPFAELELLLEAKDPSDFTHRLEAIRVVSQSSGVALTSMIENRSDLDHIQIRLGALKKVAVEKTALVETQLAVAQEAAAVAAVAKAKVDKLVAREQVHLDKAKSNQAEIKAQYQQLAAEQSRIRAQIAEAARRAEARAKRIAAEEAAREAAARDAAARKKAAKSSGGSSGGGSSSGGSSGGGSSSGGSSGGGSSSGGSSGSWLFPVAGYAIGSNAGWRFHPILRYTRCHAGADIGAPSGATIRAVAGGVVISAGWNGGYGNFTTIAHGNGVTSSYAHQSSMRVSSGQRVRRGQTIGYVGSTGLSSGPHLHFEVRVYGAPYNPRGWFGTGSKTPVCV